MAAHTSIRGRAIPRQGWDRYGSTYVPRSQRAAAIGFLLYYIRSRFPTWNYSEAVPCRRSYSIRRSKRPDRSEILQLLPCFRVTRFHRIGRRNCSGVDPCARGAASSFRRSKSPHGVARRILSLAGDVLARRTARRPMKLATESERVPRSTRQPDSEKRIDLTMEGFLARSRRQPAKGKRIPPLHRGHWWNVLICEALRHFDRSHTPAEHSRPTFSAINSCSTTPATSASTPRPAKAGACRASSTPPRGPRRSYLGTLRWRSYGRTPRNSLIP